MSKGGYVVLVDNLDSWTCPVAPSHLRALLERVMTPEIVAVTLRDENRYIRLHLQRSGSGEIESAIQRSEDRHFEQAVLVDGTPIAVIQVSGTGHSGELLDLLVNLTTTHLSDLWSLAQQAAGLTTHTTQLSEEIDSLAGEIVHTYEELHLLYELADALTGHLTVSQVADLILEKTLNTLQAAWAELSLHEGNTAQYVRLGSVPPGVSIPRDNASQLSTTLRSGGKTIGRIVLVREPHATPFSSAEAKLLDAVGTLAGSATRNAQLYEELRYQATTDPLTGLVNHRTIQDQLDQALAQATKDNHAVAVIMIDIDDFKLFNDTYGHLVGDQILRLVSSTLKEASRTGDIVGRYGGDEFIMILPRTDCDGATAVAQRILSSVHERGVVVSNHETIPLALSMGVATYPEDAVLKHDLLSHADAALYETKRRGGNGVRAVEEPLADEPSGLTISTTFSALHGLVNAVDAKDRYTRDHSEAVTQAALLLAKHLNLSSDTCRALRIAGLLHDVGKIGIPDRILRKPGRLTPDEYQIMKQHVALSELIIKEIPHLVDVLAAVATHHEKYDGSGYPRGLRGDEIPLLGRIMALADACSAMLISRPYRKGLTWSEAVTELRRGAGTQFDPALIEPFIMAMEQSNLVARQERSLLAPGA